jgi:hypothetical protein
MGTTCPGYDAILFELASYNNESAYNSNRQYLVGTRISYSTSRADRRTVCVFSNLYAGLILQLMTDPDTTHCSSRLCAFILVVMPTALALAYVETLPTIIGPLSNAELLLVPVGIIGHKGPVPHRSRILKSPKFHFSPHKN